MKRNGFGEEEADKRLASQPMTDEERAARAAVVLSNAGTEEELIAKASAKGYSPVLGPSERTPPRRWRTRTENRVRVVLDWSQAGSAPQNERTQLRSMSFLVSLHLSVGRVRYPGCCTVYQYISRSSLTLLLFCLVVSLSRLVISHNFLPFLLFSPT